MVTAKDLKEYRLMSNLSLRDVARYCGITAQAIGQIETGVVSLNENTYHEIVNGINRAKQAIADGRFADDKSAEKEAEKIKIAQKEQITSVPKKTAKITNQK